MGVVERLAVRGRRKWVEMKNEIWSCYRIEIVLARLITTMKQSRDGDLKCRYEETNNQRIEHCQSTDYNQGQTGLLVGDPSMSDADTKKRTQRIA